VTIFVAKGDGLIELLARAEGEREPGRADAGDIGDLRRVLEPGQSAFGKTFEQWQALESPSITIDDQGNTLVV
jgi:hypothetical protein